MIALRIHDREVLASDILKTLFIDAFKEQEDLDAEDVWEWCMARVLNENTAVIVARNDDCCLVGLAVCDWYPNVWSPAPWILHLYSSGEKKTVAALLAEVRVWGLGLGQGRVRSRNVTGISDKAYIRFVRQYVDARADGGMFVGEWKED